MLKVKISALLTALQEKSSALLMVARRRLYNWVSVELMVLRQNCALLMDARDRK
jgi:hypothetical protein